MSEQKKKKAPIITTPAGIAKFPRLTKPDTKFNPEGVYKCTLILNDKDPGVSEFKAKVLAAEKEAQAEASKTLKKGKKLKVADSLIRPHLNDEEEEVEGMFEITAKMRASGVSKKDGSKWTRRPALFDSTKKPVKANVGGGSKVKLAVALAPFDSPTAGVGVSCRLEAVQIIELCEFGGGGNADSYGFGEEEGGYAGGDEPAPEGDTGPDSGDRADTNEGHAKNDF